MCGRLANHNDRIRITSKKAKKIVRPIWVYELRSSTVAEARLAGLPIEQQQQPPPAKRVKRLMIARAVTSYHQLQMNFTKFTDNVLAEADCLVFTEEKPAIIRTSSRENAT
ncbi:hypothetical protein H4Q26_008431 [Puccinia striiformis f. sp. tritici PST-130]|nr:hypothetical protein H4Q26_008431 [Puccinia striiformis f. sp. tritici PST-130]